MLIGVTAQLRLTTEKLLEPGAVLAPSYAVWGHWRQGFPMGTRSPEKFGELYVQICSF